MIMQNLKIMCGSVTAVATGSATTPATSKNKILSRTKDQIAV